MRKFLLSLVIVISLLLQFNSSVVGQGSGITPKYSTPNVYTAASQAAMLALSARAGDYALRSDTGATFILKTLPATILGNWSQVAMYQPISWLDAGNYATLALAEAAAFAAGKTLVVSNAQNLVANLTVRCALTIVPGGTVTQTGSYTLTINGPFEAGDYQVFSGFSASQIIGLPEYYPKWFGAKGDGTTDDTTAVQVAMTSAAGKVFKWGTGSYKVTTKVTVPLNTHIIGEGAEVSTLRPYNCIGLDFAVASTGNLDPTNVRNFSIYGYADTSESTGIGIRAYGSANPGNIVYCLRIRNVRIGNLNTAIYLRTARDADISGCVFTGVYHGIRVKGQVVVARFHNNDIIHDHTLGSGTSYGVEVNSASNYDPGGATELRPEDIQIYQNRIYGFDYGVYNYTVLYSNIKDNDIDYCQTIGVYIGSMAGSLSVSGNWISLGNTAATHGIFTAALAASQYANISILDNNINASATCTSVYGIEVRGNQRLVISRNTINLGTPTAGVDIILGNTGSAADTIVTDNYCYSNVTISFQSVRTTAGVIKVAGNYFRGTVYFHPTASVSQLDMGYNSGTFSTRIKGKSAMAENGTSVSTLYANLTPTPPDLDASVTTFLLPQLIIYAPSIELGYVWGKADATGVTINCSDNSHAATDIYWEVVLVPNFTIAP